MLKTLNVNRLKILNIVIVFNIGNCHFTADLLFRPLNDGK